jgi:hypothetical protein
LNQDTPVIVVSALKEERRFHQACVHAQLHKPVLAASLVDSLSSAGVSPRTRRADGPATDIVPLVEGGVARLAAVPVDQRRFQKC